MTVDIVAIATFQPDGMQVRLQAVGDDPDHARALLAAAWRTYLEQVGAAPVALADLGGVEVSEGGYGAVFMDGAPFQVRPAGHGACTTDQHVTDSDDPDQPHDGNNRMLCAAGSCDEPIFYCTETGSYHHVDHNARPCWLISEKVV